MELFDNNTKNIDNTQTALLIYVEIYQIEDNGKEEFIDLVNSTGVQIFATNTVKITTPKAKYLIGEGKVIELKEIIAINKIDTIIFNADLTPSQERNLEKFLNCQVLDRVALILDIFALRARSFEGKLQVELAQLKHLSTRLIKGWTHLERQKGGIGLRGPGETQLESDKRLIAVRIKNIKKTLVKVSKRRALWRKLRKKNNTPVVTLTGYTNAGKSTLFNKLTKADVYADDRLFATLDATIRQVILPALAKVVMIDTVGFINNLPTDLVQAFSATLEESVEADILLHIVDSSDYNKLDKISQVNTILMKIGADKINTLLVMNKIDNLNNFNPRIDRDKNGSPFRVWISAKNSIGIDLLYSAISEKLSTVISKKVIHLKPFANFVRSQIYEIGYINSEKVNEFGEWILEISVTKHYLDKLLNIKGVELWQKK